MRFAEQYRELNGAAHAQWRSKWVASYDVVYRVDERLKPVRIHVEPKTIKES